MLYIVNKICLAGWNELDLLAHSEYFISILIYFHSLFSLQLFQLFFHIAIHSQNHLTIVRNLFVAYLSALSICCPCRVHTRIHSLARSYCPGSTSLCWAGKIGFNYAQHYEIIKVADDSSLRFSFSLSSPLHPFLFLFFLAAFAAVIAAICSCSR